MEHARATAGGAFLGCWLACLAPHLGGCEDEAAPPPAVQRGASEPRAEAEAPSLLSNAAELERALALATEPLPKPIRALSLRLYPDRLLLQVQARRDPARVHQYRVKSGRVLGPVEVELQGPGELEDNVFPLQYADLEVIPRLVKEAESRAALEAGRAVSVSLQRNLPASMDIRFQVLVQSPHGKRRVEARKDGKILGVHSEP